MKRFGLSQNLANVIMPTILLYYELLRLVDIDMLVVMPTTFTEGYTMYYVAQKTKHPYMEQLQALRLDMMRRMANKYLYDSIHSTRIESYCNVLFEALYKFIGLRYETKYLLQMAAIFMKRVNLSISANTTSVRITSSERQIYSAWPTTKNRFWPPSCITPSMGLCRNRRPSITS